MNPEQLCLPLCPCVCGWDCWDVLAWEPSTFSKVSHRLGLKPERLTWLSSRPSATEGTLKWMSCALTSSPFGYQQLMLCSNKGIILLASWMENRSQQSLTTEQFLEVTLAGLSSWEYRNSRWLFRKSLSLSLWSSTPFLFLLFCPLLKILQSCFFSGSSSLHTYATCSFSTLVQ